MGKETILNSVAKIAAAPLEDYTFPSDAGSFTGTLTYRKWHRNKPALLCYFDTDDGNKYMLMVWWNSWGVSIVQSIAALILPMTWQKAAAGDVSM